MHAHSAAFLGEETVAFEFLQMMADRWLGQSDDRRKITGAGLLIRLGQQMGDKLKAHRIGKGLEAYGQGNSIIRRELPAAPQRRAADRRSVIQYRESLGQWRMMSVWQRP